MCRVRRKSFPSRKTRPGFSNSRHRLSATRTRVPGIHGLRLYAAGRYDEYEIEGPFEGILEPASNRTFDDFVTKLGVVYYPAESLKLRATWGQAFLAATLPELFGPVNDLYFLPVSLILSTPWRTAGRSRRFFPPPFLAETPTCNPRLPIPPRLVSSSRQPECPGCISPRPIAKIDFEGLIGSLSSAFGWPPVYAFENWQQFPDQIKRDANGVLTYLSLQSINLSARTSEALDFDVRYAFATTQEASLRWVFSGPIR